MPSWSQPAHFIFSLKKLLFRSKLNIKHTATMRLTKQQLSFKNSLSLSLLDNSFTRQTLLDSEPSSKGPINCTPVYALQEGLFLKLFILKSSFSYLFLCRLETCLALGLNKSANLQKVKCLKVSGAIFEM